MSDVSSCHDGHGRDDSTDAAHVEYRRSFLRLSVDNEEERLSLKHGDANAPMGGWRNRAIENVAYREAMNPYSLDHIIRGIR